MTERDDIPKRLREQSVGDYSVSLWDEAADEITRLRADLAQRTVERDEARREVCELLARSMKGPMEVAADRGWDCFEEAK